MNFQESLSGELTGREGADIGGSTGLKTRRTLAPTREALGDDGHDGELSRNSLEPSTKWRTITSR